MEIRRLDPNSPIQKVSGAPPYPDDICPVCETKATGGCRCMGANGISNDRFCANRHTWYWDNGKVIIGSHHSK